MNGVEDPPNWYNLISDKAPFHHSHSHSVSVRGGEEWILKESL